MNKYLKWGILAGIFLITFIPFIVANGMFFPYIVGKNFVFRILVELTLGAWILLAIRDSNYRPKNTWVFKAIIAFVAVVGIADIFGVHFEKSFWSNFERMDGYITTIHLFGYFLIASTVLSTEKLWHKFFATTLVASVISGLFFGIPELIEFKKNSETAIRIDGTFGNPIYLAVYSLFHIFIGLFFISHYARKNYIKIIVSVVVVFNLYILYWTATRGTMLGLITGFGVMTLLIAIFEKEKLFMKKIAIGLVVAGILMVGGFIGIKNTDFVQNSPVLKRFADISLQDNTVKARFMVWDMAYDGWKERPILGWGQGNFTYVFSQNYNPEMYAQEPWFDRAHNVFFDWLIAGGILGLLAYLSLYFAILYHLWKKDENDFSIITKSLFTGLLAGYFVHNIFVFDNLISYIFFFTILAYIHFRADRVNKKRWFNVVRSKIRNLFSNDSTFLKNNVLPALILIGVVFVVYSFNYKPIVTNKKLILAMSPQTESLQKKLDLFRSALEYDIFSRSEIRERLILQAIDINGKAKVPQDIKEDYSQLVVYEMSKQVEEIPGDSKYALSLAFYFERIGRFEDAETYSKLALQKSPYKQSVLFELGSIYINVGRYEDAVEMMKQAYDLAPDYKQAKRLLAFAYIYNNQSSLANELLDIDNSTAVLDKLFVKAYVHINRYDLIVKVWEYFVELEPDNAQNYFSLAASYVELGQKQKAIEVLDSLAKMLPETREQVEHYKKEVRTRRI